MKYYNPAFLIDTVWDSLQITNTIFFFHYLQPSDGMKYPSLLMVAVIIKTWAQWQPQNDSVFTTAENTLGMYFHCYWESQKNSSALSRVYKTELSHPTKIKDLYDCNRTKGEASKIQGCCLRPQTCNQTGSEWLHDWLRPTSLPSPTAKQWWSESPTCLSCSWGRLGWVGAGFSWATGLVRLERLSWEDTGMGHREMGDPYSPNPLETGQHKHLWRSHFVLFRILFHVVGIFCAWCQQWCLMALPGVFFSIGELWRTTRRFTVSSMRNLGMGKQMMEGKVFEELHFLIETIKSFKGELGTITVLHSTTRVTAAAPTSHQHFHPPPIAGEPFSLRSFNIAPINITFLMLFGDRFDYKDPTFLTLLRLIDEVMILLGSPYLNVSNLSHRVMSFSTGTLQWATQITGHSSGVSKCLAPVVTPLMFFMYHLGHHRCAARFPSDILLLHHPAYLCGAKMRTELWSF